MLLVDANVLIYAVNEQEAGHVTSRDWLAAALGGADPVAFPWLAILAFLRVATHPSLFARPITAEGACNTMEAWLASPVALVVHPGRRHLSVVRGLLEQVGTGGNLVNDAHLAALAVEHGATIISFDRDFGRFPGVKWREPSAR